MFDTARRLGRRVSMALGIGRLTNNVNESQATPTIQVALSAGEQRDNLPFLQHYGFVSHPMPGTDIISVFQAGDRDRGVAIASNDQRYRPKGLQAGEVALYHKSRTLLILKNDGSVDIKPSNGKIRMEGELTVTKDILVQGKAKVSGDVTAGSISLQKHVHSKGDKGQPTGKPI